MALGAYDWCKEMYGDNIARSVETNIKKQQFYYKKQTVRLSVKEKKQLANYKLGMPKSNKYKNITYWGVV